VLGRKRPTSGLSVLAPLCNGFLRASAMMGIVASRLAGETTGRAAFTGRLELAYRMTEERLGNVPYFAGPEFTAATS